MAEKANVKPNTPRICSKQIYRQSVPPDSNRKDEVESYCLRNIVIPFLENVYVEVDKRIWDVLRACTC